MTIRLCVLLWPVAGRDDDLRAYEDTVLPLLADHRGRLLARETVVRTDHGDPLEVQLIELRSQADLEAYMADPRRIELEEERARAIARTQVLRLETGAVRLPSG